jgi:hypothetical protein
LLIREQDNIRKREQSALLNKFINTQSALNRHQLLEMSKAVYTLKVKNYAGTIVGKISGSMAADTYNLGRWGDGN